MLQSQEAKKFIPDNLDSNYSQEILRLLETLQLSPSRYLSEGTINHGWLVQSQQTGEHQILVIGPAIGTSTLLSTKDSGYLDTKKFTKARRVTDIVLSMGIPAIKFSAAGISKTEKFSFAWGVEEIAGGVPLSELWHTLSEEEKLTLAEEIGGYMAKYQRVTSLENIETPESSAGWYLHRMSDLLADAFEMEIFDVATIARILSAFHKLLNSAKPHDAIGLIHGDLFSANIFVKKDQGKYSITNIIDWETATIGHIGYEQILSSWWLAGERGGNKEIFETILRSSTAQDTRGGFDSNNLQPAITLVDMFWHINVIVSCTALDKMTDVLRWKKNLLEIVSLIEQNKPYAIFSGE